MPAPKRDPLSKHRKYLAEVPDDFLEEKLALFQVKPEEFAKLPQLVISGQRRPVEISPKGAKPAKVIDIRPHVRRLHPQSLDELKELAGLPNRSVALDPDIQQRLPQVDPARVAKLRRVKAFKDLDGDQRDAFWVAAQRLLNGSSAPDVLAQPGYSRVSELMLDLAKELAALLATDLIVADGQTVSFTGIGTFYFNNVLVYGTGSIRLGGNAKLHAYQISHI